MKRKPGIKRVLIAHQATIPHYRLPFYLAVERMRPEWWEFSLVYDMDKKRREKLYTKEEIDEPQICFGLEPVKTKIINIGNKKVVYQPFFRRVAKYDLLVIENVVYNLSYPLAFLYLFTGKPVMIWGHGRDLEAVKPSVLKQLSEIFKLWQSRKASGFFAYTNGVKEYLVSKGVKSEKIFTLNNTIDIKKEREIFLRQIPARESLRAKYCLEGNKVLLFVGRFNHRKRLEFLSEAFSVLYEIDSTYKLVVVGSGNTSFIEIIKDRFGDDAIDYHGMITDPEELGPLYVVSDVFIYPGDVGLAPLQALCYDLTPVVIDAPTHNPEYEYLNPSNALILPEGTSPQAYADAIDDLIRNEGRWASLRTQAWPSIKHLTIENMACQFIKGINSILEK